MCHSEPHCLACILGESLANRVAPATPGAPPLVETEASENEDFGVRATRRSGLPHEVLAEWGSKVAPFIEIFAMQPKRRETVVTRALFSTGCSALRAIEQSAQ